MTVKIGYVEDDEVLRLNYIDLLESEGYEVLSFSNFNQALDVLLEQLVDLVILDVGLGEEKEGGFKLCKLLRDKYPSLPIIFLTSHDELNFQSKGWRYGADDYVTKDTEIELVLLRIRALLKRVTTLTKSSDSNQIAANEQTKLNIDYEHLSANWKNQKLNISLTQLWILNEIYTQGGQAVDYEQLQKAAKIVVEPNTIAAHVKIIRQAFTKIDANFQCICTERGRGYRWVDDN